MKATMPTRRLVVALVVALAAAGAAMAEQVIYFTNGTSMPIRTHRVEEAMIYVDMGDDNYIAFPFEMVERIEDAGKDVLLRPGSATNRIFGDQVPTENTSYPVGGQQMTRSKMGWRGDGLGKAVPSDDAERIEPDDKGLATHRPMGWSNGAQRRIRVTGSRAVTGGPVATNAEDGIIGTSRLGSRHVLGGVQHPANRGGRQIVGFEQRTGGVPTPPPPPAEQGGDDAGAQQGGGEP